MFTRVALLGVAAAFGGSSCRSDEPPPECSGEPAFVLTVSAGAGALLPDDLEIEVRYGGSADPEVYRLGASQAPEVVFCMPSGGSATPGSGDAGAGSGGHPSHASAPGSVSCELWTEGPASVVVRSTGYPPLELDLQIDEDRCTVVENLELMRGDGGAGG